jgi:hypothetical protein
MAGVLFKHCHVARVRNQRVEPDVESLRQLDFLEIALERVGLGAALGNDRDVGRGARRLELTELLEVVRGILR